MPDQLPIYQLASEGADVPRLIDVARRVFGIENDFTLGENPDNLTLRSGQRAVELATASGGVWAADEAQLWKPSLRPTLPSEREAVERATEFARQQDLMPRLEGPFKVGQPVVGGTHLATNQTGKREDHRLDVQVIFPVTVGELPIVGGGGDTTVILGDQGAVIGYSGAWRPVKGSFDARVVDPESADKQFRAMTEGMKIASFDRHLAYYAAPSFRVQEHLYPVYVYSATAVFGEQRVPLRQIMLPATDFGPPIEFGQPQPPRPKADRRAFAARSLTRRSYLTASPTRPWEAGTSWIGLSGGLAGSKANAQGFVDEWAAAGWHIDFNWGDANAWESDWRKNDDTWVDNADFVFYTGHANQNGWVLSSPDDTFLHFNEVGGAPAAPGDLWGSSDLEWVIVAACGPLQDEVIVSGGGDVFDRWDGAFDGMHILMGYGAVTLDNTDEGRKVSQYAKGGQTLIDAWFRTAKEIQPPFTYRQDGSKETVWVGAMWVGRDGIDPGSDHAWDYGSVSNDPTAPTWYAAMWTTC